MRERSCCHHHQIRPSYGSSLRCPGLNEWGVDGEILTASPTSSPRRGTLRHVHGQQTVGVLREHPMIPLRIVHAQADGPAEQEVVAHPLHNHAFRMDRLNRLEQQHVLGRNHLPTIRGRTGELYQQAPKESCRTGTAGFTSGRKSRARLHDTLVGDINIPHAEPMNALEAAQRCSVGNPATMMYHLW